MKTARQRLAEPMAEPHSRHEGSSTLRSYGRSSRRRPVRTSRRFQGGGKRDNWASDHRWLPSMGLRRATRKPASTRTLPALTARLQIRLLALAQVARQPVNRANEIGDGVERRRPSGPESSGVAQPFAHDIGFRATSASGSRTVRAFMDRLYAAGLRFIAPGRGRGGSARSRGSSRDAPAWSGSTARPSRRPHPRGARSRRRRRRR